MEIEGRPVCKRCLLLQIDPEGLYKKVNELIAVIPEDVKTDQEEYKRRLGICRECDGLENGICRECGCFVELRAATAKNRCPSALHKWEGEQRR